MTGSLGTHHLSGAVLRIRDVEITKPALELALDTELDRYETSRDGSVFVQVDIPHEADIWGALASFAEQRGPALLALQEKRLVGSVGVDLAVMFRDALMAASVTVPSEAAALFGRYGIDITFSVYRTSDEP